jgi:hypothetical protein
MNIRRGRQITRGRFQRLVPHPVLDSAYVETPPEHTGGIRGPERLQIEFFETGAFGDQFATSQEVLFPIAGSRAPTSQKESRLSLNPSAALRFPIVFVNGTWS